MSLCLTIKVLKFKIHFFSRLFAAMEIFDKFTVVDEKSFADFKVEHREQIRQMTRFAALQSQLDNSYDTLTISDKAEVPLTQIICWEWNKEGEQVIKETKLISIGSILKFEWFSSIVVRIIRQKQEKSDENQCPPLISSPDDHLTVQIGHKTVTVSAHWLMFVSPMVRRMLTVEMREKQQRLIILDKLGVDMEKFMEFMEYISLNALHKPSLPNPKNVEMLLKLADYFQVDWLKLRCEMHLINCVEIPLIDRFFLSEKYGLFLLKNLFLRLNVDKLRVFYKANHEQLLTFISKEFLGQLLLLFCE